MARNLTWTRDAYAMSALLPPPVATALLIHVMAVAWAGSYSAIHEH